MRSRFRRSCLASPFCSLSPAITALAVGVAMGLATLIGPLAGGIVAFLLFAAVAGGLGWYGAKRAA